MRVHAYEKFWIWASVGIIVLFVVSVGATTFAFSAHPPSHVETIDPQAARTDPRFAEPGVTVHDDGSVTVVVLAQMFAFLPNEIRVPRGRPVTFRLTSPDVIHGFQIVQTNGNTMVVPGYVSQFTIAFDEPGERLIVCNEFCGLGHHVMFGKLIVEGGEAPGGAQ